MKDKTSSNSRFIWIDYTRVYAILFVVLCHATESYYGAVVRGEQTINFIPWIVENSLFTVGRLGVPLFLAITGALMLSRELDPIRFYKKSLLPLVITTEIWIVFNYFFACAFQGVLFQPVDLITEMLFLKSPELSHMWYMPMIIGVYVALPFLAKLTSAFGNGRCFIVPGVLAVVSCIVVPTVNVFLKEALPLNLSLDSKLDLSFLGGTYGIYLFGGYFIGNRKVLAKVHTLWITLGICVALALNTAGQYFLYSNHYYKSNRLLWYTSLGVCIAGLLFFELLRRMYDKPERQENRVIRMLARCSFGIYLLHKPLMVLAMEYLSLNSLNVMARIGCLLFIGAVISFLILLPFILFLKRTGKVLFHIK